MKPTIDNVIKLLIGKSAVCNLYTTNTIEPMAFVITDVKIVKYSISVKGENTPWFTDNTVTILGCDEIKSENKLSDVELFISKLHDLGSTDSKNFNDVRKMITEGSDKQYPIGSYTIVVPDKNAEHKNCFAFVRFWKMWSVVDNIYYPGNVITHMDLVRAIRDVYSSNRTNTPWVMATPSTRAMFDTIDYFWRYAEFDVVQPTTEEVVEYLTTKHNFGKTNAKVIAGIIKPDREGQFISTAMDTLIHMANQNPYKTKNTKNIDVQNELVCRGLPVTQAKLVASIIKPIFII